MSDIILTYLLFGNIVGMMVAMEFSFLYDVRGNRRKIPRYREYVKLWFMYTLFWPIGVSMLVVSAIIYCVKNVYKNW